ncbi:MAG: hypothetical protein DRO88_10520 [Promethearchaeia archaeon]|nr:MAG: hypothetical protein DRO88_10520 [Candidatus Lokiarchaeia archaeon]
MVISPCKININPGNPIEIAVPPKTRRKLTKTIIDSINFCCFPRILEEGEDTSISRFSKDFCSFIFRFTTSCKNSCYMFFFANYFVIYLMLCSFPSN